MGNNFKNRILKGKILSVFTESFFKENKIPFITTGYENFNNYLYKESIKNLQDNLSLYIRFEPDYSIIYNDKSFYVEIKNSSGIEKKVYNHYKALQEKINTKILIVNKNKKISFLDDIVFQNMNSFHCKVSNINLPIVDNVWITPNKLNEIQFENYLESYNKAKKYTSGDTFAFIDFYNTKDYDLNVFFKNII
tara:strand:+ start:1450 stop:2028 length:579 start_codon:yes stop_codon:yes gene_type:complete